jgi:hypothetical protein
MAFPWWAASIAANATVIGIELINRHGGYGSFSSALVRTFPLIMLAQFLLYRSMSGAPSWLIAAAVFSFGTAAMRVCAAWGIGERVSLQAVLGLAVMLVGMMVVKAAPR